MAPLEQQVYDTLLVGGVLVGAGVFVSLFFISAPYGRHTRAGWGPSVPTPVAWVMMELPAALGFAVFYFLGRGPVLTPALVFLLMWEGHYLYRSVVFPARIRSRSKRTPVLIVLFAVLFNLWNTYLNGRFLGVHAPDYTAAWFLGPRFLLGASLFAGGLALNIHSDTVLIRLRRPGEQGYKIPHGGGYRWVSCPNYLGEIIEWCGWAVATWSLPGLVFALWTMANLAPRARTHHQWYRERFPEYPPERKAVFPGLF